MNKTNRRGHSPKIPIEERKKTIPGNKILRELNIDKDPISPKEFYKRVTDPKTSAWYDRYKASRHIPLLLETFERGEGADAFCADALITEETFYEWLKRHADFGKAYKFALRIGSRKWQQYPLVKPDINYLYWRMIVTSRFGLNKIKVKAFKENVADKTALGRMNALWEAIAGGELTSEEIARFTSVILAQSTIENGKAGQTDRYKVINETREEVMQKVASLNQVLAFLDEEEKKEKE